MFAPACMANVAGGVTVVAFAVGKIQTAAKSEALGLGSGAFLVVENDCLSLKAWLMGAPAPTYAVMVPRLALFIVPEVPLVPARPLVSFGPLVPSDLLVPSAPLVPSQRLVPSRPLVPAVTLVTVP